MAKLPVIDADSHVEECEETLSHLEPDYADRRPIHLSLCGTPGLPRTTVIGSWTVAFTRVPECREARRVEALSLQRLRGPSPLL